MLQNVDAGHGALRGDIRNAGLHYTPLHVSAAVINNGKIIFEEIPEVVNQVYHWHELFASPDPSPRMLSRVRMRPADICIQNTVRPRAKEIVFWLRR